MGSEQNIANVNVVELLQVLVVFVVYKIAEIVIGDAVNVGSGAELPGRQ
jgi:hypothetical protein